MMGDNRASSRDSRYFGSIEKSSVIGRVFVRIWPPGSIGLL
jgi:type IV secretory pathway protease TraF